MTMTEKVMGSAAGVVTMTIGILWICYRGHFGPSGPKWAKRVRGEFLEHLGPRTQKVQSAVEMSRNRLLFNSFFKSEKLQNESFPNFSNFRPEFCSEFCSEFSPKIPAIFQCKIPRQTRNKYSQNSSGEQAKKYFSEMPVVHNSVCSQFLEGLFVILGECSQFCLI